MLQKLTIKHCPITDTRIVIVTDSRGTEHITVSEVPEIPLSVSPGAAIYTRPTSQEIKP